MNYFLFYDKSNNKIYQYESTYDTRRVKLNENVKFKLKNQFSNSNYNYRADYINVESSNNLRNYTGLFTGNNEELGKPNIELNYEFYNSNDLALKYPLLKR